MDEEEPAKMKSALLDLLVPPAPSRNEFEGKTFGELVAIAEGRSIDEAALAEALDAADPKSAVLDLLVPVVPPAAAVLDKFIFIS